MFRVGQALVDLRKLGEVDLKESRSDYDELEVPESNANGMCHLGTGFRINPRKP
jgi:hypothetical protein